jgi:hypothetical protein
VLARKTFLTSGNCSSAFFRRKSFRLFEQISLCRKVENFSYCLSRAFFQQAWKR